MQSSEQASIHANIPEAILNMISTFLLGAETLTNYVYDYSDDKSEYFKSKKYSFRIWANITPRPALRGHLIPSDTDLREICTG